MPSFTWVADDLAVGGRLDPAEIVHLRRRHGIRGVVDLRSEAADDAAALRRSGLSMLRLPTVDHAAIAPRHLVVGLAFARRIARGAGRLLVHCEHGIGRSAAMALAILVDRGFPPLEALDRMKTARWQVSPSPAQIDALTAWLCTRPDANRLWPVPSFDAFAAIAYRHLAPTVATSAAAPETATEGGTPGSGRAPRVIGR